MKIKGLVEGKGFVAVILSNDDKFNFNRKFFPRQKVSNKFSSVEGEAKEGSVIEFRGYFASNYQKKADNKFCIVVNECLQEISEDQVLNFIKKPVQGFELSPEYLALGNDSEEDKFL
jgi:hypothetical protein